MTDTLADHGSVSGVPDRHRDRRATAVRALGSTPGRVTVVLVATVVAFHYTLSSLLASLGAENPLAYLGLVPLVALVMAFATARPRPGEPQVHDRHLDWILGVPGLVVPLLGLLVLPAQMSTFFWVSRIDVLLLPMFVGGAVALLFGSWTLFRIRVPVLYLLLAWPVPSRAALALGLDRFTSWTVAAVTRATTLIPVGHPVPNVDGAFRVQGPAGSFTVMVASVCSGANSLVGFLLIGGAAVLVAKGRRRNKLAWLAMGAAVVWVVNVVRIMIVFAAGDLWGQDVAMNVFHPYVGLVSFALAMLGLVMLLPLFGLGFAGPPPAGTPTVGESTRRAVPRFLAVSLVLAVVALPLASLDARLRDVDPVASAVGQPKMETFQQGARLDGFDRARIDHFDWATQFFGRDSDWTRFQFSGRGTTELTSQIPVIADVVTTSDLQSFDDYDVEACYRFHGYGVNAVHRVDLGHGQIGSMLAWHDPHSSIQWLSLYWYWPVSTPQGTRYQRIVLLVDTSSSGDVKGPAVADSTAARLGIAIDETLSGLGGVGPASRRDADFRRFLTGFGRQLVATSAAHSTSPGSN